MAGLKSSTYSLFCMKVNCIKKYILLSLLAPNKVAKKRHSSTGPVKQDSLVTDSFAVGGTNSSRFVETQTCAALVHKKTCYCGTVKMGSRFSTVPFGDQLRPCFFVHRF